MDRNNRVDPLYRVIRIMSASAYIASALTVYCHAGPFASSYFTIHSIVNSFTINWYSRRNRWLFQINHHSLYRIEDGVRPCGLHVNSIGTRAVAWWYGGRGTSCRAHETRKDPRCNLRAARRLRVRHTRARCVRYLSTRRMFLLVASRAASPRRRFLKSAEPILGTKTFRYSAFHYVWNVLKYLHLLSYFSLFIGRINPNVWNSAQVPWP